MKGFGTDELALIRVLATKDPLQIQTLKDAYQRAHRRDLINDIKSETGGYFEKGLVAICDGPLLHDVHVLHESLSGPGTKESVLNDVLLGRSNADIRAIKSAYSKAYRRSLEDAVKADLSFKTERHFLLVLQATRAEDAAPVHKPDIDRDVHDIYNATEGKVGTDEMKVCSIFTSRNDNQIRAIAHEYQQRYARSLEDVIRKVGGPLPFKVCFTASSPCHRNSRATWRTRFCTSCDAAWTSTCTKPPSSRTPWPAPAPRTAS